MTNAAVIALCVLAEYVSRSIASEFVVMTHNPGAAFGILRSSPGVALALSGLAWVVIVGAIYIVNIKKLTRLGLSIMAGGALSNLLERIFLGYVIDWIPVPFFDLQYNLADVLISLGALIVFLAVNKHYYS